MAFLLTSLFEARLFVFQKQRKRTRNFFFSFPDSFSDKQFCYQSKCRAVSKRVNDPSCVVAVMGKSSLFVQIRTLTFFRIAAKSKIAISCMFRLFLKTVFMEIVGRSFHWLISF